MKKLIALIVLLRCISPVFCLQTTLSLSQNNASLTLSGESIYTSINLSLRQESFKVTAPFPMLKFPRGVFGSFSGQGMLSCLLSGKVPENSFAPLWSNGNSLGGLGISDGLFSAFILSDTLSPGSPLGSALLYTGTQFCAGFFAGRNTATYNRGFFTDYSSVRGTQPYSVLLLSLSHEKTAVFSVYLRTEADPFYGIRVSQNRVLGFSTDSKELRLAWTAYKFRRDYSLSLTGENRGLTAKFVIKGSVFPDAVYYGLCRPAESSFTAQIKYRGLQIDSGLSYTRSPNGKETRNATFEMRYEDGDLKTVFGRHADGGFYFKAGYDKALLSFDGGKTGLEFKYKGAGLSLSFGSGSVSASLGFSSGSF